MDIGRLANFPPFVFDLEVKSFPNLLCCSGNVGRESVASIQNGGENDTSSIGEYFCTIFFLLSIRFLCVHLWLK